MPGIIGLGSECGPSGQAACMYICRLVKKDIQISTAQRPLHARLRAWGFSHSCHIYPLRVVEPHYPCRGKMDTDAVEIVNGTRPNRNLEWSGIIMIIDIERLGGAPYNINPIQSRLKIWIAIYLLGFEMIFFSIHSGKKAAIKNYLLQKTASILEIYSAVKYTICLCFHFRKLVSSLKVMHIPH